MLKIATLAKYLTRPVEHRVASSVTMVDVAVVGAGFAGMAIYQARAPAAQGPRRPLPNVPKFGRLWSELPAMVKDRLRLSALLVSEDGSVLEIT
jgi:hypothetical protein